MSRAAAGEWPLSSCTSCWLLMPALLLTNCIALYSLYSYKRAYDCVHREHAACIAAQQAHLSARQPLREKEGKKEDSTERSLAAEHARPAHRRRALAAPPTKPSPQQDQRPASSVGNDGEEQPTPPASPLTSSSLPPPVAASQAPSSASAVLRFHPQSSPSRVVHHMDALQYLSEQATLPGCVVTSLPDVSEMPLSVAAWRAWFVDAVAAIISRLPADGLAFFYQTDVRMSGCWADKSFLLNQGGEKAGGRLVWHKIVVQSSLHSIKGAKAAYAHLLCFSPLPLTCRQPAAAAASSSSPVVRPFAETGASLYADILSSRGAMTWKRAMGLQACDFCVNFIVRHTPHRVVIDPFCGVGSALAVANARGCDAIGVDLNRRRCALARKLDVTGVDLSATGKGVSVKDTRAANGEDGDEELSRGVSRRRRRQLKKQEEEARRAAAAPDAQQETDLT